MGTLVLNSLCSVIQPDERVHRETGEENKMRENAEKAHLIRNYTQAVWDKRRVFCYTIKHVKKKSN